MDNNIDSYKTIIQASKEGLFKDRGSKFYGYAFPVTNEEEIKEKIEFLKKQHYNARHWCYAWQLGENYDHYRANDDGEPSNSAGMPIYGQLQSFDVTNTVVVIARLFGGTKLGVGGLISAYKTAAQITLESCEIIEKTIDVHYIISFDYKNMNKVMRVIKEKNLDIVDQGMEINEENGLPIGIIEIKIRKKNAEQIADIFNSLYEIDIQIKAY